MSMFGMCVTGCSNTETETKESINYKNCVDGLRDWYVEINAQDVDFLDNVKWNETYVKKVKVDSSKVDLSKEDEYEIVYKIVPVDKDEKNVKVKKTVTVVSEEEADKLVEEGKEVVTTEGVKNEEETEAPTDEEVKETTSNTDSSNSSDKASTSSSSSTATGNNSSLNKNNSSSNTGSTKKDTTSSTSSKSDNKKTDSSSSNSSSKNDDKKSDTSSSHTHKWVEQFKTVHHDAQYEKQWVVDKEAYTEQVPITQQQEVHICNGCGADITNNPNHMKEQWKLDPDTTCRSWRTEVRTVTVGYNTVTHAEEGHYENVLVKEAYDEKVSTGYKCSTCGATK